jgi:hypothetical protein
MRGASIGGAMIIALLCMGAAGKAQKAKEPQKPAPKKKAPQAIFAPLVRSSASWTLYPEKQTDPPSTIVVEAYDARDVKGARVARLRWSLASGQVKSPLGSELPTQLAVGKKGVWLLDDKLDDAGVERAMKGTPSFTDPPAAGVRKDGTFVRADGDALCVGHGPEPGDTCAKDTVCSAEFCLDASGAGAGVTAIGGLYTPDAVHFAAPTAAGGDADLRTGVPACDQYLTSFTQCMTKTMPDQAATIRVSFVQMADEWRKEIAADPDMAAQLGESCRMLVEQSRDQLVNMGCSP